MDEYDLLLSTPVPSRPAPTPHGPVLQPGFQQNAAPVVNPQTWMDEFSGVNRSNTFGYPPQTPGPVGLNNQELLGGDTRSPSPPNDAGPFMTGDLDVNTPQTTTAHLYHLDPVPPTGDDLNVPGATSTRSRDEPTELALQPAKRLRLSNSATTTTTVSLSATTSYAATLCDDNGLLADQQTAIENFCRTTLRSYCSATLHSLNIKSYVDGVSDQLIRYLRKNLPSLGLPVSMRDNEGQWAKFKSVVSKELTQQRSEMQRKVSSEFPRWLSVGDMDILQLEYGYKEKQDVKTLSQELVTHGVKVLPHHNLRSATLRHLKKTFDQTKNPKDHFWDYVDDWLAGLRRKYRHLGPAAGNRALDDFFQTMLQKDVVEYPAQNASPDANGKGKKKKTRAKANPDAAPAWQLKIQAHLQNFDPDVEDAMDADV
ncbi:hypothetical protein SISNIDRAFT_467894 [Sistotremastrum niveocremeum HHB9708]|uniref:Uncharacterized protein n=1 Tax=Sistotremastrum niveocremeum HHB9708 TaxID=1314777 RepID=A0A164SBK8_9AGAM|nr:hypothetical protein SISNIDRAFT_467894 [Sistotremastrum niveocremeum HHB9708]